jgi:hypothetical protein
MNPIPSLVRGYLRPFSNNRSVQPGNLKAVHTGQFYDILEKLDADRVLPLRIRIGEVGPDISKTHGADDSVCDGMAEHIGIRMPPQSLFITDFDTSDNELPAFYQPVGIISE